MRRLWPSGGLWRHADFLKLWSAETISVFGSQFTGLALPLVAVLLLDASAFAVSALFVIEFLPFILFAIPAGVWVDRLRRKPILVLGDLSRAALLVTIPIAYAFDALTMGHLYVVGFLVGIGTVFFDVAYQSYLPSLVEREQLVDGNSKLEVSRSTSQLARARARRAASSRCWARPSRSCSTRSASSSRRSSCSRSARRRRCRSGRRALPARACSRTRARGSAS